MANRFAFLYEVENIEDFLCGVVRDLAQAGLSLGRPPESQVVRLDEEGNDLASSIDDLQARIIASGTASFLLWFEEEVNVYCRVRAFPRMIITDLGFEGCDTSQIQRVKTAIRRRFLDNPHRSFGLVFDPDGITEDYDWDLFFLQDKSIDICNNEANLPAMLGCRKLALGRIHRLPLSALVHDAGDLVLVERRF